jgi:hypothetical protein
LRSIVDYTLAPDAISSSQQGPAIDPIFGVTETESWYWTSTTLLESPPDLGIGGHGIYISFGQAFGWMEAPPGSGNYIYMNVHGAGSQRSDPKIGDPANWPYGLGPQGDEIRIFNYVRCARGGLLSDVKSDETTLPDNFKLEQNYPNPFNPSTTISFSIPVEGNVSLKIFNTIGQDIATIVNENLSAGSYSFQWNAQKLISGVYFYRLTSNKFTETRKMILLK